MKFRVESQSSLSSSRHKVRPNSPPASLQDWLDKELERRGIDAVVYTRYILSILLQDTYDLDSCRHNAIDEDICSYYFCNDRKLQNHPPRHKNSGRKSSEKFICSQHQIGDHEQRKKSAAVECLKSVSEEKYGIEELVEDLCAKLKELQLENDDMHDKNIKSQQASDEITDVSPSYEEQAKKYYAAFPALSGKSTDPVIKLSITSERSDMIVEKSAWMSRRQSLFDRKDFSPPPQNDGQHSRNKKTEDCANEYKTHQPKPTSKSLDGKFSVILPKVKSTRSARFSTVFSARNKPPFQSYNSNSRINKHCKPLPGYHGVGKSSVTDGKNGKADLSDTPRQNQESSEKFIPLVPSEDDEILAKFINKFNTENMAAIWDKMFQPQYLDSMLTLPQWKDATCFSPTDYQPTYLSIWSATNDLNDPLIFSNVTGNEWFDNNICLNDNCFGDSYLQGLKDESTWPTHHQGSFSLFSYCHDSDGPRRFSLTLSDESDDLCSLSHIFHDTTSKDSWSDLETLCESNESFHTTPTIHIDDTLTTTSLNIVLPSDEYVSLVMCAPAKISSTADSLLTSEETHFRPIRQESLEIDESSPDETESKCPVVPIDNFPPLEEDVTDDEKLEISDNEENESRDSWSPDMKDCFSTVANWQSCGLDCNTGKNLHPNLEEAEKPSEWAQITDLKFNKSNDQPLALKCEKNPSWASDSSWHTEICKLVSNITSDTEKDGKTPLNINVGPWIAKNPCPKTGKDWSMENTEERYTPWKCNKTVWSDNTSTGIIGTDRPSMNHHDEHESSPDSLGLWRKESSDEGVIKSCQVVEALRVEIKEETKQLFDDIHDMISKDDIPKDDCTNFGPDINDEALCEWMLNVDLNSKSTDTTTLPQLESSLLDDMLEDGSAITRISPDDIVYSSELEAEWIKDSQNFNVQVPRIRDKSLPKNLPRPCSFFMEGTCRRSDCKFSHDLSKITCRFWEEGACFKGITCPFLHGYPLSSEESDFESGDSPSDLNLQQEDDFPTLLTSESKTSSPETVDDKTKKKACSRVRRKKRQKKSCSSAQQIQSK